MKRALIILAILIGALYLGFILVNAIRMVLIFPTMSMPDPVVYDFQSDTNSWYDLASGRDTTILTTGVTIINFWATWCKPCIKEMPDIQSFQDNHPHIQVMLLSYDDPEKQIKFLKDNDFTLKAFYNADTVLFNQIKKYPTTLILKDGDIKKSVYRAFDWSEPAFLNFVDSLARG